MTFDFKDQNIIITGGSRGIGKACAQVFAQSGGNVIITYKSNSATAEETLAGLPSGNHSIWQLDVSDPEAVEDFYKRLLSKYPKIDVLVNNAGVFSPHPVSTTDYPDWLHSWRETIDTNLIGAANMCYFAGRQMIGQGGGKIVNISSRGAFRGEPNFPAYGASKAGLNSLSQSLAIALAPHNISVHIIAPGFVETDMALPILEGPEGAAIKKQSPFGRVARPDEVARLVAVYASEGLEFTSGGIVDINGASYLRS